MEFRLSDTIKLLSATPGVLKTYLSSLPSDWLMLNEGGESWSPYDIVGHLIHGEKTDWIPRLKIILSDNPNKTFEPFDRFAQMNMDNKISIVKLLEEFEILRRTNIEYLESLQLNDDQLAMTGNHPEFGTVSLQELLASWVVHDLGHISQISRVLVRQMHTSVGPWKAYLTILNG